LSKYCPGSLRLQVKVPRPLGFSLTALAPNGSRVSQRHTACCALLVITRGVFRWSVWMYYTGWVCAPTVNGWLCATRRKVSFQNMRSS